MLHNYLKVGFHLRLINFGMTLQEENVLDHLLVHILMVQEELMTGHLNSLKYHYQLLIKYLK